MILTINLRRLRNASFIAYGDDVVTIGTHHDLTALGLKPANDAFIASLVPLNAQYATEQGSLITDKIVAADARRDKALSGVRQVVEGFCNHFEPATAEAATQVKRVFDKYGSGIQNLTYLDQTGAMKSLIEDLQMGEAAVAITNLGLTSWVVEMKESNESFSTLYAQRTTELSQKPSANMLELRTAAVEAWQKLVRSTNAVNELTPGPAILAYEAEVNALIKQYNRLIGTGGESNTDTPISPE